MSVWLSWRILVLKLEIFIGYSKLVERLGWELEEVLWTSSHYPWFDYRTVMDGLWGISRWEDYQARSWHGALEPEHTQRLRWVFCTRTGCFVVAETVIDVGTGSGVPLDWLALFLELRKSMPMTLTMLRFSGTGKHWYESWHGKYPRCSGDLLKGVTQELMLSWLTFWRIFSSIWRKMPTV